VLALFMVSTLAPGDLPGADQTNLTPPVRECDEQKATMSGVPDQDLAEFRLGMVGALEVDVLDAHPQALEEPQSTAEQELTHGERDVTQLAQQVPHLGTGQDDRHASRPLGARDAFGEAEPGRPGTARIALPPHLC
jgi:hypothetical protein